MNKPQGCTNCGHTQKCHAIGGEFVGPDQTCISWTPQEEGQSYEGGQVPPSYLPRRCASCRHWEPEEGGERGLCEITGQGFFTQPDYSCALWAVWFVSLGGALKEERNLETGPSTFRDKSELPENDPWRNHPDATAEGWCKIPVIIAKQLRTAIDCVVPNTLMKQSDLTNSNLLEMGIYLDNAVREGNLEADKILGQPEKTE